MDIILGTLITIIGTLAFNFWQLRHTESQRWDKDRLDSLTESRIAVQRVMGLAGAMVEGHFRPSEKGRDPEEISKEKDLAWYALEELAILFPGVSEEVYELQQTIVDRVTYAHQCLELPNGREVFKKSDHQSVVNYIKLEEKILLHCQGKIGLRK